MIQQDILHLLQPILGIYRRSTHNRGRENYAFYCPFCRHHKQKLEIDLASGHWHCWTCDAKGKTPYTLLKRLSIDKAILDRVKQLYQNVAPLRRPNEGVIATVNLPSEFKKFNPDSGSHFQKIAAEYLKKRNLSEYDIERYNIGYCEDGPLSCRIIIPNYDSSGLVNFWTARSFTNDKRKYCNPSASKDFIGFEFFISWDFPIILCEGVFDAISIRKNAIPLYGKTLSLSLKEKILEEHPPAVFIALDPDAIRDMIKIAEYLTSNGISVYLIELREGDPNKIGYERFWQLVQEAKKFEILDSLQMKLGLQ